MMKSGGEGSSIDAVRERREREEGGGGGEVDGGPLQVVLAFALPSTTHPTPTHLLHTPCVKVRTMADVWVERRLLRAQTKAPGLQYPASA